MLGNHMQPIDTFILCNPSCPYLRQYFLPYVRLPEVLTKEHCSPKQKKRLHFAYKVASNEAHNMLRKRNQQRAWRKPLTQSSKSPFQMSLFLRFRTSLIPLLSELSTAICRFHLLLFRANLKFKPLRLKNVAKRVQDKVSERH